mmetsp:Transcript_60761/g.161417  ORF Transcript_60761/g.161417 Transcript_60761/m.161417 type:complete len:393 (-) Transcript_60761:102-1280(-)
MELTLLQFSLSAGNLFHLICDALDSASTQFPVMGAKQIHVDAGSRADWLSRFLHHSGASKPHVLPDVVARDETTTRNFAVAFDASQTRRQKRDLRLLGPRHSPSKNQLEVHWYANLQENPLLRVDVFFRQPHNTVNMSAREEAMVPIIVVELHVTRRDMFLGLCGCARIVDLNPSSARLATRGSVHFELHGQSDLDRKVARNDVGLREPNILLAVSTVQEAIPAKSAVALDDPKQTCDLHPSSAGCCQPCWNGFSFLQRIPCRCFHLVSFKICALLWVFLVDAARSMSHVGCTTQILVADFIVTMGRLARLLRYCGHLPSRNSRCTRWWTVVLPVLLQNSALQLLLLPPLPSATHSNRIQQQRQHQNHETGFRRNLSAEVREDKTAVVGVDT